MTLNLVKGRLWKGGACTKPVPLGQATGTSTTRPSGTNRLGQIVLVPVGKVRCLYQICPTGTGKGKKRPLLVPGTGHRPTLEVFPCPGTSSIPTMEPVLVPLVPTCPTKWVYKAVNSLTLSHLVCLFFCLCE